MDPTDDQRAVIDSRATRDPSHTAIRLTRRVAQFPKALWTRITDPAGLATWFPCTVEVDGGTWTPGARIRFGFPPEVIDLEMSGEVLAVEAPRTLSFTWGDETLHVELAPVGEFSTLLALVDELPPAHAARNAAGWEECLDRLAGETTPATWQEHFDAYVAAFEPQLGPQEGPPAGYKGG